MAEMTEVECEECKRKFSMAASLWRWRNARSLPVRFCSRACKDRQLFNGIGTYDCAHCGAAFQRPRSRVRKNQRNGCQHLFCSRTCAAGSGLRAALLGYRHIEKKAVPSINMTAAQAGYLAGLIDGEGSFSLYTTRNGRAMNVSLAISNTDERLLHWCRDVTGVGTTIAQKRRADKDNSERRAQYIWAVNARNDLRTLLPLLIPYLIGKAEQARVVLRYCDSRANREPLDIAGFAGVVSRLNRRGKPDKKAG